ncbi:MAG: hypothetical protein HQ514_08560, partial [Rhodospirillales bacterium]|nr:hypothetical protein [Rhodospirillales bacterium]
MLGFEIRGCVRSLVVVASMLGALFAAMSDSRAKVFEPKTFTLANGLQ